MKKTILIFYERDASSAPRVHKQINALKNHYNILLASQNFTPKFENTVFIKLPKKTNTPTFHLEFPMVTRKLFSVFVRFWIFLTKNFNLCRPKHKRHNYWSSQYKAYYSILIKKKVDLIITHHTSSLPLSAKLKKAYKCPLIMNAHEYYPLEFSDLNSWLENKKPIQDYICTKYLPLLDNMFSVAKIIGERFKSDFQLKKYVFIPNDKSYHECKPSAIGNKIRIIHHGAAIASRKIELMIELMSYLDPNKYELDLMLTGKEDDYKIFLRETAGKFNNVRFINPVNISEIVEYSNQYDIGLFILPPTNFNYLNALPNKFYEFIQSKLCLCITPNPEMKRIMEQYDLGVNSTNFDTKSMAEKIKNLSHKDIMYYKTQCDLNAETLSSEKTEELIRTTITDLIN